MDSDTSNKSYTLEHGVVKRVLEHGAYLELTNTGRTGYLHISALRDERSGSVCQDNKPRELSETMAG